MKSYHIILVILVFHNLCFNVSAKGCLNESDCPDLFICQRNDCIHKGLFPISFTEIIGLVILGLIVGIANSGGTAGTPFMIPVLIYFFNFPLKEAIMCCYMLVLGGCLGNYFKFSQLRNKETGGPLINYNIVMLCLPMTAIGSLIGNFFNLILPNFVICSVMMVFLIYAFIKIIKRTKKEIDKEKLLSKINSTRNYEFDEPSSDSANDYYSERNIDQPITGNRQVEISESKSENTIENSSGLNKLTNPTVMELASNDEYLQTLLKREISLYPIHKLSILFGIFVVNTLMSFLRGSHKFPSILSVDYCSAAYFSFMPLDIAINCIIFVLVYRKITYENAVLDSMTINVLRERIHPKEMKVLGLIGLWAGFYSGLLGFGAGIVITTYLVGRTFSLMSTTATTIVVIIFTSAISTVQVFVHGNVDDKEMGIFFIIAFSSSLAVGYLISAVIESSQKQSILLLLILIKIFVSFFIVPYLTLVKIFELEEGFFDFKLC